LQAWTVYVPNDVSFPKKKAGFEEILVLIVADDELIFLGTYVISFQKNEYTVIDDDDERLLSSFFFLSF